MTQLVEPHTLLWTKTQYAVAAAAGAFDGTRVELINGEIIAMSPMTSRHAAVISLIVDTLKAAFGAGYYIPAQTPLDLGDLSEPEPDVAVYTGHARDYLDHIPSHALLVVEVAETSLRYDRSVKATLYASAGIAEYWIVNLKDHTLEVYRDPTEYATDSPSYGYKLTMRLLAADTVSPLAFPTAAIQVADLLP